ncbi:hypothetical protein AMR41_26935 [Hapalosiphon sp. MRB220]|nr:hypothetical protein AMR41_26935 [Hapalosiphon sp. MRB220]
MKFLLNTGRYKGFSAFFEWDNIPDFAVLTGENGAGKTQLLEMIYKTIQQPTNAMSINGLQFHPHEVVYFPKNWAFINNPQPIDQGNITGSLKVIANALKSGSRLNNEIHTKYLREKIIEITGQDPTSLSTEQIIDVLPKNASFPRLPDFNFFLSHILDNICNIFYRYCLQEASFVYKSYREKQAINQEEIRKFIGEPPWELVNRLLERAGLRYKVTFPQKPLEAPYELKMIDNDGALLEINDLSSGEKTLLGLTLLLYTLREDGIIIKLLLLDEPDVHLHSSLIQGFLTVMETVVVKEFRCKIILTTHRPDTIILAPEGSIFVIKRSQKKVVPISPSEAISHLSNSLLLVQKNTISVLVESDDDERFYNKCFQAIVRLGSWKHNFKIEFRSVSKATVGSEDGGGSTLVKSKVNIIRKAVQQFKELTSSTFIFGLIDRDEDNTVSDGVQVISRYSIENYIFDPLVIYCRLLELDVAPDIAGIENIHSGDYALVRSMDNLKKQTITNSIIEKIEAGWNQKITTDIKLLNDDEKERVEVAFVDGTSNNTKLALPKWLINRRGHDIEKIVCSIFEGRTHKGALISMYGELRVIPTDILNIFGGYDEIRAKLSTL